MKSSGNRSCKTFPLDLMFSWLAFCNTFRIYQLCFFIVFHWWYRVLKKNNHPHIHGHMELFAPPCPQLNVGHSGCTRRPSEKTTILVTGASHYNLLQHWVGGAGGAAIALLDVDVVVFFEEPGITLRQLYPDFIAVIYASILHFFRPHVNQLNQDLIECLSWQWLRRPALPGWDGTGGCATAVTAGLKKRQKEKGIAATGWACRVGWLGWLWESDFRRSSACWHPFAPLSTAHKAESQRGCQETRPGYGRDRAQEHRATSFDGRLACAICLGLFKCWIFLFLGERDGKTTCIWGTYRLAWAFVCRLPGEATQTTCTLSVWNPEDYSPWKPT